MRVKNFYFIDPSISDNNISFANMKSFLIESGVTTGFASSIQIKSNRVNAFMKKFKAKKINTLLTVEGVKIKPGVGGKKEFGYSTIPTITSLR